jgi:DNA-binding transcriptional LysR family regulator
VRISRLENSSLIARRLAPFSVKICGSPELIAKHGMPARPQDLARMPCIIDTNGRWLSNWPFKGDDSDTTTVSVSGPIEVNSPMTARAAAVSGLGFAILPDFIARPEMESGRLVAVLDDRLLQGSGIFAVYPHRRYLPAKVRVLVDFLVQWFKSA